MTMFILRRALSRWIHYDLYDIKLANEVSERANSISEQEGRKMEVICVFLKFQLNTTLMVVQHLLNQFLVIKLAHTGTSCMAIIC